MLEALAHLIQRRARQILIAGGVFLLAAIAVVAHGGRLTVGEIHGIEAERAELRVEKQLGISTDTTVIAVFASDDTDAIDRALAPLRSDARVRAVMPPSTMLPPLRGKLVNRERHTAAALIFLAGDFKSAVAAYPAVHASLARGGVPVMMTGRVPFQHDLDAMLRRDLFRAELVALPITLLVLLLVFRTPLAAALPVVVGSLAVLCGIAIVLALSHVMDIASYTINVASLVGLGVAIDYSLFAVSRYREELAAGRTYPEALRTTLRTSGRMIAFSGLAVSTGLAGLCLFRGSYLASMGLGGAIVVGLAVLFSLTILPSLLVVLGPRIHAGRIRFRRPRLAWILAHPWRVLVPCVALLLTMATPFLHLRLVGVDASVLDPAAEARRGLEALHAFPDLARTRIIATTDGPAPPELARSIALLHGVAAVESPAPSIIFALTDAAPQSEAAQRIVRDVRALVPLAPTLAVGGQPALDLDSASFIAAHTPAVIAFVVLAMIIVLFATFRSAVLPLKAVLMNFMSITASLGAMVWVFQEGHLFVSEGRPLDPSVPVLLFCILFGLSIDYHVLMISRMRESFLEHRDNARAVVTGLERCAGLITSAAAIMVTVFAAFAFARFVVIRSIGFGMALAVALDATLIRLLVVPASMKLIGRWNWWPTLGRSR